jgi:hypothetical protein
VTGEWKLTGEAMTQEFTDGEGVGSLGWGEAPELDEAPGPHMGVERR